MYAREIREILSLGVVSSWHVCRITTWFSSLLPIRTRFFRRMLTTCVCVCVCVCCVTRIFFCSLSLSFFLAFVFVAFSLKFFHTNFLPSFLFDKTKHEHWPFALTRSRETKVSKGNLKKVRTRTRESERDAKTESRTLPNTPTTAGQV